MYEEIMYIPLDGWPRLSIHDDLELSIMTVRNSRTLRPLHELWVSLGCQSQ